MKDSDVSPPSGKWKVFVGALIRVLDKGLDILVPLGMCMIGVLQIFPDYRIKASAADAVIDMSVGWFLFNHSCCFLYLWLSSCLSRPISFL